MIRPTWLRPSKPYVAEVDEPELTRCHRAAGPPGVAGRSRVVTAYTVAVIRGERRARSPSLRRRGGSGGRGDEHEGERERRAAASGWAAFRRRCVRDLAIRVCVRHVAVPDRAGSLAVLTSRVRATSAIARGEREHASRRRAAKSASEAISTAIGAVVVGQPEVLVDESAESPEPDGDRGHQPRRDQPRRATTRSTHSATTKIAKHSMAWKIGRGEALADLAGVVHAEPGRRRLAPAGHLELRSEQAADRPCAGEDRRDEVRGDAGAKLRAAAVGRDEAHREDRARRPPNEESPPCQIARISTGSRE